MAMPVARSSSRRPVDWPNRLLEDGEVGLDRVGKEIFGIDGEGVDIVGVEEVLV
jgi:hypothetical protein